MAIEQVLETLTKLVSFRSITPYSSGSLEYIAKLLTKSGFSCDIQILEKKKKKRLQIYMQDMEMVVLIYVLPVI